MWISEQYRKPLYVTSDVTIGDGKTVISFRGTGTSMTTGETEEIHRDCVLDFEMHAEVLRSEEEPESLQDYDAFPVVGSGVFEGVEGTGGIFRDMIQVQDAEVLFHYADAFYLEFAAVTRKQTGRGTLYYVGCGLEEKITKLLMEQVMRDWHRKALWSSSSSRERGTKRGFC